MAWIVDITGWAITVMIHLGCPTCCEISDAHPHKKTDASQPLVLTHPSTYQLSLCFHPTTAFLYVTTVVFLSRSPIAACSSIFSLVCDPPLSLSVAATHFFSAARAPPNACENLLELLTGCRFGGLFHSCLDEHRRP